MSNIWKFRRRNYEKEKTCISTPTRSHPLNSFVVTVKGASADSSTPAYDPLSKILLDESNVKRKESALSPAYDDDSTGRLGEDADNANSWSSKRNGILRTYTTTDTLVVPACIFNNSESTAVLNANRTRDTQQRRLDKIDDLEDGGTQEKQEISQRQFINSITEQASLLKSCWDKDQRVKALKIIIQCAKLLADVDVIRFYPSKFVLVTDILDSFGKLVYERIKSKSFVTIRGQVQVLPDEFDERLVPDIAKETSRNWIYKISSIRELLPRFYLETSILACWKFFTIGEYKSILIRLTKMIRGISNPLVSMYARCYLCRVGKLIENDIKEHLMPCFDDFLFTYSQLSSAEVKSCLSVEQMSTGEYFSLFTPAIDWLITCIAEHSVASGRSLIEILKRSKKRCYSTLLLSTILRRMPAAQSADHCYTILCDYVNNDMVELGAPRIEPYIALGLCCSHNRPPPQDLLQILNIVWKVFRKLENQKDYITCTDAWIIFVVKNFSIRELDTVLKDINKHFATCKDNRKILFHVFTKILLHHDNISELLLNDNFMRGLDLFGESEERIQISLLILNTYNATREEEINEPEIIDSLIEISKQIHQSIGFKTPQDQKQKYGQAINSFIGGVSFGRDLESALSFYVNCRASFANLQPVIVYLIHCVNRLSMKILQIRNAKHSTKTSQFVRATVAYTFITIPSIEDALVRLNLYVLSGRVALINQCLAQGDAFTKAAVNVILDICKNQSVPPERFAEFLKNLFSNFLVVPDNPELGILSLPLTLLNMLKLYPWREGQLSHVFIDALTLLASVSQLHFIYYIDNVQSNLELYGGDEQFLKQIYEISSSLMQYIMDDVETLNKNKSKEHYSVCFHLINTLIAHGDFKDDNCCQIIIKLWKTLLQYKEFRNKFMMEIHKYMKRSKVENASSLVDQMKLESSA